MSCRTPLVALSVSSLLAVSAAGAAPILTVFPAEGPNPPGITGYPSLNTFSTNIIYAMEHGLTSYGDPTMPSYYQLAVPVESISQNIGTTFNSWNGNANPTGNDANEFGNHIYFGLHVVGNGTRFSVSQLGFSSVSSDPNHTLNTGPGTGADYQFSTNYSFEIVGLDYGPDRTKGTSDDFLVTSGSNTQLVDELYTRGVGNYWHIDSSSPGSTNQSKINNTSADYNLPTTPFTFTGTYTLDGASGSGTVTFNTLSQVPEPATTVALALVVGALLPRRRKA